MLRVGVENLRHDQLEVFVQHDDAVHRARQAIERGEASALAGDPPR